MISPSPFKVIISLILFYGFSLPSQAEMNSQTTLEKILKPHYQDQVDQAVINQLKVVEANKIKELKEKEIASSNIPSNTRSTQEKTNSESPLTSTTDSHDITREKETLPKTPTKPDSIDNANNVIPKELEKIAMELQETPLAKILPLRQESTVNRNIKSPPITIERKIINTFVTNKSNLTTDTEKNTKLIKKKTKRLVKLKETPDDNDTTNKITDKLTVDSEKNKPQETYEKQPKEIAQTPANTKRDPALIKASQILNLPSNETGTVNETSEKGRNSTGTSGWIYLGQLIDGKWQQKTLNLDAEEKLPKIGAQYLIAATSVNVRHFPMKKEDNEPFHWFKNGTEVTVLQYKQSGRGPHYWAEVTSIQ